MLIRILSPVVIALLAAAQSNTPPRRLDFHRESTSTTLRIDALSSLDEVRSVRFSAESVNRTGSIIRLRGAVKIQTSTFVMLADDAEYNRDNGEISANGNVRIQLTAPREK